MNKIGWFTFLFFFLSFSLVYAVSLKKPNVAGSFYSVDPKELSAQIDSFLNKASIDPSDKKIQAMIVPHAGYAYSGSIAAYGYKAVSRAKYSTIVILAPSHFFPFEGVSVWSEGGFQTPLGVVNVNTELAEAIIKADSQFKFSPKVFEKEHSLEVQLPFIQKVFPTAKIVPILMGIPDQKVAVKLASVLDSLTHFSDDILVIASSDMSHYFPYDTANGMDERALGVITQEDASKLWDGCFVSHQMEMCGIVPVTTLLLYAKARGLKAQVLKHANSGDTAGDKSKVVGYSSVIFYKEAIEVFSDLEKKTLLKLARETLEGFVTAGRVLDVKTKDSRFLKNQGAFVTLRKNGQLRGCIGHIMGDRPLWQTIQEMTIAAAASDHRFPPVIRDELESIDLEISVLTFPQRVTDASAIVLGKDGVIISDGGMHEGVFLPQVADETRWSKEEFLSQLCSQKAGLSRDCWKDSKNSLFTFQADVFSQ